MFLRSSSEVGVSRIGLHVRVNERSDSGESQVSVPQGIKYAYEHVAGRVAAYSSTMEKLRDTTVLTDGSQTRECEGQAKSPKGK